MPFLISPVTLRKAVTVLIWFAEDLAIYIGLLYQKAACWELRWEGRMNIGGMDSGSEGLFFLVRGMMKTLRNREGKVSKARE